jgi:carboxyl-terminal processing protease
VFPLIDQSSAKITIARYFLPNGTDISRKVDADGVYVSGGLKPDIEVTQDPNVEMTLGDPATDSQLKRALEVIASKN